ncbi:hypothetical protein BJ508DRAFT_310064 [Ascobolus immersus RN42]|uniref:F-box domain-containing protein n=1 Tax=Ascobolus immersus RN42 TaxID=1160509 RepID=A0A3N4HWM6_ASCIM|nr:hypothetical protein BJ508DRAFT_310064 [Ascobolus immersus RN42]
MPKPTLLTLPTKLLLEIIVRCPTPRAFFNLTLTSRHLAFLTLDLITQRRFVQHWFSYYCNDVNGSSIIEFIVRFVRRHSQTKPICTHRYLFVSRLGDLTVGGYVSSVLPVDGLFYWVIPEKERIKSGYGYYYRNRYWDSSRLALVTRWSSEMRQRYIERVRGQCPDERKVCIPNQWNDYHWKGTVSDMPHMNQLVLRMEDVVLACEIWETWAETLEVRAGGKGWGKRNGLFWRTGWMVIRDKFGCQCGRVGLVERKVGQAETGWEGEKKFWRDF